MSSSPAADGCCNAFRAVAFRTSQGIQGNGCRGDGWWGKGVGRNTFKLLRHGVVSGVDS